jgi:hypothetical protein
MRPEQAGLLAGALSAIAIALYIRAALRRYTGSRSAWTIWAGSELTLFVTQYARGARDSLLILVPQVAGAVIICVLTWRSADGRVSVRDRALFAAVAVTLGFWAVTKDATVAIVLAVGVEYAGLAPTVTGAWRDPGSEPLVSWLLVSAAGGADVLAVGHRAPLILYAYPVAIAAMAAAVAGAEVLGAWREATPAGRRLARTGAAALAGAAIVSASAAAVGRLAPVSATLPPHPAAAAAPDLDAGLPDVAASASPRVTQRPAASSPPARLVPASTAAASAESPSPAAPRPSPRPGPAPSAIRPSPAPSPRPIPSPTPDPSPYPAAMPTLTGSAVPSPNPAYGG